MAVPTPIARCRRRARRSPCARRRSTARAGARCDSGTGRQTAARGGSRAAACAGGRRRRAVTSSAAPKLDAKTVEQIFSCLAPGLPQDWKRTWVVVTAGGAAPPKFYVTTSFREEDAEEFVPCNVQEIARRIAGLSDALPPEKRRWKSARLEIDNEGEYELKYDYAK